MTPTRLLGIPIAALAVAAGLLSAGPVSADSDLPGEITPQVVNGVPGPSDEFGFLVALGDRYRYETLGMDRAQFCGGTVVSPDQVVTAAHCVDDVATRDVVVGSFPDGELSSETGVVVGVSAIRVHPRYNSISQARDIAVLTLTEPLRGVPSLLPVTASQANTLAAAGTPATVVGWGATNSQGTRFTSTYRIGGLVVFPTSACGDGEPFTIDGVTFRGYGPGSVDPRFMLCAEGVREGAPVDSCVGDSGGPLSAGVGDARRLIGIVSWGLKQCASKLGAGVYTRVSAFTTFLTRAGVPLTPEPGIAPSAPRITRLSVSSTGVTVTVTPAAAGPAPERYVISARDPEGQVTFCSVPARPRPESAACTIGNLVLGTPYVITAISLADKVSSVPSAERTAIPAGRPETPRIIQTSVDRGGIVGFVVSPIDGNGSPVIRKEVRCTAQQQPTRSAPIMAQGIALVSELAPGTTYACVAIVANEFGEARSDKVRITAR